MANAKLIYSRNYPIPTFQDFGIDLNMISEEQKSESINFIRKAEESVSYVLNEEKYKKKDVFLNAVKFFADTYRTDVEIYEKEWGYTANLNAEILVGGSCTKKALIDVFDIADEFNILKTESQDNNDSFDVLLLLDYKTHDIYFKRKEV